MYAHVCIYACYWEPVYSGPASKIVTFNRPPRYLFLLFFPGDLNPSTSCLGALVNFTPSRHIDSILATATIYI